MSNEPRIEIGVRLDLDGFQRDYNSLLAQLRGIESRSISIGLDVDIGNLAAAESLIRDFDGSVSLNIDVNESELETAQALLTDLDGSVSLDVTVDEGELETAQGIADDLDGSVSLEVDVIETAGSSGNTISDILFDINNLKGTIDLVVNVAGTALDFVRAISDISGVAGIIEIEGALNRLAATTGRVIPGVGESIENIFVQGLGESRSQIAELIGQASQLGVVDENLEEAATSALQIANVFGEDPFEVLRAQSGLVSEGIVSDFNGAADLIASGFQNGLNVREDFLDTLDEYATTFGDLGFTGEQVLGFLDEGLDSNIDNTDRLADATREAGIRISENSEEVQNAFSDLELSDSLERFLSGELGGVELLGQVRDALLEVEDPLERNNIAIAIFGTQVEDFGGQSFIDALGGIDKEFENLEGSAESASDTIESSLPEALDRIRRNIEVGIGGALDDTFDITGFIDDLEAGIQTFFDSLESGESFATSLGLSLEVAGLQELQDTLADFVIDLLQGVRDLVAVLPGADTTGIDNLISTLGTAQLEVDLAAAGEADDIEEAVRQAVDRGVNDEDIFVGLADNFESASLEVQSAIAGILGDQDGAQDSLGFFFQEGIDINSDGIVDFAEALEIASLAVAENDLDPAIIDEYAAAMVTASTVTADFATNAQTAFDEALNNNDFATALDLNELISGDQQAVNQGFINQLRGQLEYNVEEALSGYDLQGAQENLDLLGDLATPELEGRVEELASYLEDQFATAISSRDFDGAAFIAEQIGSEDLQSTFDTIVAGLDIDEATVDALAESLGLENVAKVQRENVEEMESTTAAFTDTTTAAYDTYKAESLAAVGVVQTDNESISSSYDLLGGNIQLFGDGAATTLQAFTDQHDLFSDGILIKNGLIAQSFDDLLLGMYDAQSSIISGTSAFIGIAGGGGSSVTNNNTTVNTTNYNNSAAAASNASAAVASGFTG